jgi:hypothetical protein
MLFDVFSMNKPSQEGARRNGAIFVLHFHSSDQASGEPTTPERAAGHSIIERRLDKKASSISLLVAPGLRADGQKVLLAIKKIAGESEAAWQALLDDIVKRGLKAPELVIVDDASGLENALAALWSDVPVQRCTEHKRRNLPAHASERLHEQISNDYSNPRP